VGADAPGAQRFASVGEAIAAAPTDGRSAFRILIGPGVWREKLVVDRPSVQLIGADRRGSILTYDAAAGMAGPDGRPWGTWGSASLIVRAPDFTAANLTIRNAFDYVADLAHPQFERIGSNGAQAVALMLAAGAERSHLQAVDIIGHQDTLFADAGRGLFRGCRIAGSVDFIFGAGRMLFEDCELVSRYRPLMQRNHGWVAVPSTPRSQRYGLTFRHCRLTREPLVPPASVALGRPWRPARDFADGRYGDPNALGAAAFLHCWMDEHISADGWDEMGYAAPGGGRVFLEPGEARLREFASTGPGAFINRRRPQLSAEEAQLYTPARVLDGWAPAAVV
jgi:pectinesterase